MLPSLSEIIFEWMNERYPIMLKDIEKPPWEIYEIPDGGFAKFELCIRAEGQPIKVVVFGVRKAVLYNFRQWQSGGLFCAYNKVIHIADPLFFDKLGAHVDECFNTMKAYGYVPG